MIGPQEDRPTIPVLIGPFSGPVHGVSVINNALAGLLRERGVIFRILDLSPGRWQRGLTYHLTRATRTMRAGLVMLTASTGACPRRYIMSLDGGGGLSYNILLAAIARVIGRDLTFYHHSSRYVLSNSVAIRLLLRLCPKASHVFCSRTMAELFWDRYGRRGSAVIINNAAWITPPPPARRPETGRVRLGFLGALTAEKGVGRAIDTLRMLLARGIAAELALAGSPVAERDRTLLNRAKAEFGPRLVCNGVLSGPSKTDFLQGLDYLLFPSLYAHETQSLVVPEALAASVPVIAIDHRFVGEILGDGGLLIPAHQSFAEKAADWIGMGQAMHGQRRMQARRQFEAERRQASGQLDHLVDWSLGKTG
ncbi:MAG TPA: glycosyltransferase [Rhizomicrobium sp.]|nr:glycosyltransferase [Rhizomicrobium sp.]